MRESFSRFFGKSEQKQDQIMEIATKDIVPCPYQPRILFQEDKLDELCHTIRLHGVIQPIVVRQKGEHYELIAGERRLRAVKKLGNSTIPALIREMNDRQVASAALIENLQREGLSVIEEAHAYQKLIEIEQLTQESLAQRLGKSQSTIANKLRLLHLPKGVQEKLMDRLISERHARALLPLKEDEIQLKLLEEIIEKDLNVKQTEEKVKRILAQTEEQPPKAKRRAYSRDVRLAVNTIRHSIDLIKQTGLTVEADEQEDEQFFELTIRIPKKKKA
ncbi:nucleoid occlusion protein [Hazenella sp. IB182357]|uniref:Nucleoid occlusion protein n=1 Tax=Polycladospora coralii TaxID=2771432 RepID=A0A926RU58_9BACL|nr:nucleoid occlusion protein [Polycladospora coralii]MBD1371984.1 nucleoid occlusion protein [Polycladospora coralii]MBS7530490.1 nucleoid occlusion protein [Polycladospora coralii]